MILPMGYQELLGLFGISNPIVLCTVFFISVSRGFKIGLFYGLVATFIIDVLFHRYSVSMPIIVLIVNLFAYYWTNAGVLDGIKIQAIPGLFIGLIYSIPLFLNVYFSYEFGFILLLYTFLLIIFTTLLTVITLPIVVYLGEKYSIKLSIRTYTDGKKRLSERR